MKVSIITPCYNGSAFIERALACVKQSTYQNIEHIIIDDRSTDGSFELLQQLQKDFDFTLLQSAVNQGPAQARNQAIAHATGKYILPLDCDNYFPEDYIEKLVTTAEDLGETYSPIYCEKIIYFGRLNREITVSDWSLKRLTLGPCMDMGSLFTRDAFTRAGGFDRHCQPMEDYGLFLSMALQGFKGFKVPQTKLFYNLRLDSVSDHFNLQGGIENKQKIIRYLVNKHQKELQELGFDPEAIAAKQIQSFGKNILKKWLDREQNQPTPSPSHSGDRAPATDEISETATTVQLNDPLFKFVPLDAKRIVEIGCDRGRSGKHYKQLNPHGEYIGIETDSERAIAATENLDRVIFGDLETLDSATVAIADNSVDCIIYNDRLSSLENPLNVLKQHANWLNENGQVLARISNVQYWQRALELLRGQRSGDRSNSVFFDDLRLFTIDKIREIFNKAGLHIYEVQNLNNDRENPDFQTFQKTIATLLQKLAIDPATFASQSATETYLIRAQKSAIPPRRLLVQTNMMGSWPVYRVRVLEPDAFTRTIPGVRILETVKSAPLNVGLPHEEKVFIWQRSILRHPQDFPILRKLIELDYLIIAETDDDPLYRPEYEHNQFLNFRGCHGVQTSTEPLGNYLRQHNPNVAVFPNQLAYLPPPRRYPEDETVRIFFGAFRREEDWQPLIPSFNQVLAKYGDRVEVRVIYDRQFFEAIEVAKKQFKPMSSYEEYQAIMRSCDLAWLPLNPTRFNQMKSDLKFIECAGHGVTVLGSPTVYEASIADGETGLIYRDKQEFLEKLEAAIVDRQLRQTIARNAYQWVATHRLQCLHYRQRHQWYLSLRDRLPELNAQLRQRVPELFS
jgi:SAM-dependent methyltransferase